MRYTTTSLIKRTRIFLIAICIVLTLLSGRLIYIQLFRGEHLQLLAAEQWYRDLPLGARRGNILDRNGRIMVESHPTYSVYVRPVAVENPEHVASVLSNLLGLSYQKVYNRATSRGASEWLIQMQVERSTAIQIIAHNMPGVFLSQTYRRSYPLGTVGGQILGFTSIDNVGLEGLEAFYNAVLRGQDGRVATPSDLRGRPRNNGAEFFLPSTPGHDLVLNVDANVQNILQNALARALHEQAAANVAGIVIDIETGGILASAAAPFFDMNNQPRNDAHALITQIKNQPIINVFEPGSTFKIITLAMALELGLTTEDEKFNCPGHKMIGGERVRCWKTKGHGVQTLAQGVQNSCNNVFMELAMRIGVEQFYGFLHRFGIGRKTGVDFYGEPSGLVLPQNIIRPVDLARIGFGQALATSPIQFATTISAIVGDGVLRTPRFAQSIPQAGTTITGPVRNERIVSPETSRRVREMLHSVVSNGSGKHAGVPGFQIGGKTGTAQKYIDGIIAQGRYISSFIGFLTLNGRARYTVFLYVDEPGRYGYYGSIVAAPYVGEIFRNMIVHMNLPPDPALLPQNPPQMITIPSVAGLSTIDAIARLRVLGFHVQLEGEGNVAIGTFPVAGTIQERGAPVVIRT